MDTDGQMFVAVMRILNARQAGGRRVFEALLVADDIFYPSSLLAASLPQIGSSSG
jgi:hypothetical protein